MNNWVPQNKTIKFAAAIALVSVILYFGGLFVVLRETKKVEDTFHNTESSIYKEKEIRVIKSIVETNKESIKTLQDFFIQKGDEIEFIEKIESVAKSSSVKFEITSIDVEEAKGDSFKEDVNLKMKLEGSWIEVTSFLDKLEKMPFGVLVEEASLEANTPGDWSGLVEFIIFRER